MQVKRLLYVSVCCILFPNIVFHIRYPKTMDQTDTGNEKKKLAFIFETSYGIQAAFYDYSKQVFKIENVNFLVSSADK